MFHKLSTLPLTALTAALMLGMGAAAHAQIIVGNAPAQTGYSFNDVYGTDGYILFDTTVNGNSQTGFDSISNIITQTSAGLTNIIVQPSYVSSIDGIAGTYNAYGGYYGPIASGVGTGIVGNASGNYFSFTVGASVPAVFNFGILTNFTNGGEAPNTITLTSGLATAADTPDQTAAYSGRDNLFTITGALPGQTFTVNISNKFISGATFDTLVAAPVPAPEPSAWLSLTVGGLSVAALSLRARKRSQSL